MTLVHASIPSSVNWNPIITQSLRDTVPSSSGITIVHNPYKDIDAAIDHAERVCVTPETGKPFRFHPYWRNAFREAFQTKAGHSPGSANWRGREFLVSTARKQGKTTSLTALMKGMLECKDFCPGLINTEIPIYSVSASTGGMVTKQFMNLGKIELLAPKKFEEVRHSTDWAFPDNYYSRVKTGDGKSGSSESFTYTNVNSKRSFRVYPNSIKAMVGNIARLFVLFDELGNATDAELFNTLRTGRSEALLGIISTQGRVGSPLYSHIKQLGNTKKDYRYFINVCSADSEVCKTVEGMRNEEQWELANPVLGSDLMSYASFLATFQEMVIEGNAEERALFKEKCLNLPTLGPNIEDLFTVEQILPLKDPDYPAIGIPTMGMDLSDIHDFTAVSIYWPQCYKLLIHCFVPGAERLSYYEKKHNYPLEALAEMGYVTQSGGEKIDFTQVQKWIVETLAKYNVEPRRVLCGADHAKFTAFKKELKQNKLIEGKTFPLLMKMRESSMYMGGFILRLQSLVYKGLLHIDGIELFQAALTSALVKKDAHLNLYFDRKNQYTERIDPLIAAVVAINVEDYMNAHLERSEKERLLKHFAGLG